jgi:hypothetical protein
LIQKYILRNYVLRILTRFYGSGFGPVAFAEKIINVGFEVLTVVVTKNPVIWNITQCSLLKVNPHFGEFLAACFKVSFLLSLLFNT